MSALDDLHARQHEDVTLASDAAFEAFLAEIPADRARLDRLPTTDTELLHLARATAARRTA